MNTQQREALEKLRDALVVCEVAGVEVWQAIGAVGFGAHNECRDWEYSETGTLTPVDIQRLLDI